MKFVCVLFFSFFQREGRPTNRQNNNKRNSKKGGKEKGKEIIGCCCSGVRTTVVPSSVLKREWTYERLHTSRRRPSGAQVYTAVTDSHKATQGNATQRNAVCRDSRIASEEEWRRERSFDRLTRPIQRGRTHQINRGNKIKITKKAARKLFFFFPFSQCAKNRKQSKR